MSNELEIISFKNEVLVVGNKDTPDQVSVSIFHDKGGNIQGISVPSFSFKSIEQLRAYKNIVQAICFQWEEILKYIPKSP